MSARRRSRQRPITLLIAALGGEGGGVLTDWIVTAAQSADFPVQSTSIPGVAQRTGATTYYVEIFPVTHARLKGKRPVMALYPAPGNLDVVVASELLEAGRAIELGFVTPDRTTLIASTHRVYSIAEKSNMADGRYDGDRILAAAEEMAKRSVMFDMAALARSHGSVLNAVVLGLIAGLGVLPLEAEAFEEAIRARGVAAESNLAGFRAGLAHARGEEAGTAEPAPDRAPKRAVAAAEALRARIAREIPEPVREFAEAGAQRLVDYQNAAYAGTYLDRLAAVISADRAADGAGRDFALSREVARHLALRMSYEDIIRVADLKSRAARIERVRRDAGAGEDQPVRITEFLKPGVEEVASILPRSAGRALLDWAARKGGVDRFHVPMRVRTDTVSGFLRLRLLAALRGWRPRTFRFAEENASIEEWLDLVRSAAGRDYELALEIAECASLIKGYGDTHRRGTANYRRIVEEIIRPALAGRSTGEAAATVRAAREAALADPEGASLARLLEGSGESGPEEDARSSGSRPQVAA